MLSVSVIACRARMRKKLIHNLSHLSYLLIKSLHRIPSPSIIISQSHYLCLSSSNLPSTALPHPHPPSIPSPHLYTGRSSALCRIIWIVAKWTNKRKKTTRQCRVSWPSCLPALPPLLGVSSESWEAAVIEGKLCRHAVMLLCCCDTK